MNFPEFQSNDSQFASINGLTYCTPNGKLSNFTLTSFVASLFVNLANHFPQVMTQPGLLDQLAAYCTEMVSGKVHFTPQSSGKTMISIGRSVAAPANICTSWLLPRAALSLAGLSAQLQFCVVDELPQSFCFSPRAVRRVSAGLLWL